jgi:hypothetical protein
VLATAASPELIDYYNQRDEPLFQALMDRPQLLADVTLSEIEPLSSIHGAVHPRRALEPVELLQSAGRWADAVVIARSVEDRQPPDEEGAHGRRLAGTIARGAELAQALADGPLSAAELTVPADAVTSAAADLEAAIPGGVKDGQLRYTLDVLLASAMASRLLLASPVTDPARAADGLDQASGLLLGAPSVHASGVQRGWIARAWQIAALLLRYDAGVRAVSGDAPTLLQAAKRQAEVLLAELSTSEGAKVPDGRAFCRLFAACVRAAQMIMFEKTFMRGSRVSEAEFHNELERLPRNDPELEGRLTRRDAVAGGFDDLLHDDVIAELKVSRGAPVTVDHCARYVGQPTQYGVGRGSQLSVLVVFDHGCKEAPPGVIDNYIDWLRPRLHGLVDPRYPSLVGVLIVNTNLPIPSSWSRRCVEVEPVTGRDNSEG